MTEKFSKLHERFLRLATDTLCDADAGKAVADDAIYYIRNNYSETKTGSNFMRWAMDIFDERLNEQLLLASAKAGSQTAENRFFEKLRARLIHSGMAYSIRDVQEREDVVQETLVIALDKYKSLDKPLIPWTYSVLRNMVWNFRRKKRMVSVGDITDEEMHHQIAKSTDTPPEAMDPSESLHYKMILEEMLKMVENSSETEKTILENYCSGGGRQELLEKFPDMNPRTIDTHLSRFRKRMKQKLQRLGVME